MKAAVVANPARPGIEQVLRDVVTGLAERGWDPVVDGRWNTGGAALAPPLDWNDPDLGFVVTLGGDGTLLHAVRALGSRSLPVFGVNLGGLGFLTATTFEGMWQRLEPALVGEGPMARRMTLAAEVVRGDVVGPARHALNDAVVHKGGSGARVLRLALFIEGDMVGAYPSDGLILSTPTGGTGYSLSAGGPLLVPDLEALIVTPICAHTLAIRPIVTPAERTIEVRIERATENAFLIMDGQVEDPLATGDVVRVRKGEHVVTLAGIDEESYYDALRRKLMWGGRAD